MNQAMLKPGDFTGLADNYSRYRPDYSNSVLSALMGLLDKPFHDIDFVDVGAGTGIWSRMVSKRNPKSSISIEPNDEMRESGMADCKDLPIRWLSGSAEHTTLDSQSCDWLTMASSFHWADFDLAIREFHRVLRPGGRFTALWNPRLIEVNPILVEIEEYLHDLKPDIKRVSSGRSGITEVLTQRLWESSYFDDIVYIEGRHVIKMTPERYIGIWKSVNDLYVQLGPDRFQKFLSYAESRVMDLEFVEATYLTRAWSARRKENE